MYCMLHFCVMCVIVRNCFFFHTNGSPSLLHVVDMCVGYGVYYCVT